MTRVMVVDDEALFCQDIATLLRQEGFDCSTAPDGETAIRLAENDPPDILLCDLMLPGINGIETVKQISRRSTETRAIMMTAHAAIGNAIEAFRLGVVDYLLKPIVPEDLLQKVRRCVELHKLEEEVIHLRREICETTTGTIIVGETASIRDIKTLIARIGKSRSPALITGDSGTGKELVARTLHETCCGPKAPFFAINCAALPRDLLESELFGYERGAFTGAIRGKLGYFELADRGTLFLDELGEMPIDLQPKLLRAIEQQEIIRLGAERPVRVNVRIVAATNRDVKRQIAEGRFREDLYFRLSVVNIHLPPLRERRDDIPLLVQHLIRRLNRKLRRNVRGVTKDAMRLLMGARWRGNVRELDNVLERALLVTDNDMIGAEALPPELRNQDGVHEFSDDLRSALRAYEREHIRQVLEAAKGNREEAARRLGIDSSTLYRRMKSLEV